MEPTTEAKPALTRTEQVARTRSALIDAALVLFSSKGFDATTADEIAAAAGVSTRTFFRHFPTKESVFFFDGFNAAHLFASSLRSRPADMPEIEAIKLALLKSAPYHTRVRRQIGMYQQVVASSLVLRGRQQAVREQYVRLLAEAIAARRGEAAIDRGSNLLAALCYLILDLALDEWLGHSNPPPLETVINAHFDLLIDGARAFGVGDRGLEPRTSAV